MNLTMNSTITELSVHACNFVLKVLHREEPEARVWPKFMLKLQPKIAIFQNFSIFACLPDKKYELRYFNCVFSSLFSLEYRMNETLVLKIV